MICSFRMTKRSPSGSSSTFSDLTQLSNAADNRSANILGHSASWNLKFLNFLLYPSGVMWDCHSRASFSATYVESSLSKQRRYVSPALPDAASSGLRRVSHSSGGRSAVLACRPKASKYVSILSRPSSNGGIGCNFHSKWRGVSCGGYATDLLEHQVVLGSRLHFFHATVMGGLLFLRTATIFLHGWQWRAYSSSMRRRCAAPSSEADACRRRACSICRRSLDEAVTVFHV